MPQQHKRLTVSPRDRRVRHTERIRLHAPGVVLFDGRLGDLVTGIRQQLPARSGQLGQVVGERGRECPYRTAGHRSGGDGELRGDKVEFLGVFLQFGANDFNTITQAAAQCVEQLLAADTAGVPEHEIGTLGGRCEILHGLGDECIRALLDAGYADQPWLAKERRARQRDQLARRVTVGLDVSDLEAWILRTQGVTEQLNRALGEESLGARDEQHLCGPDPVPAQLGNGDRCLRCCLACHVTPSAAPVSR